MKEATKRAASEALAQMLAVTAMLVIASFVFYCAVTPSLRGATRRSNRIFCQPGSLKDGLLRGACHRARIRATR